MKTNIFVRTAAMFLLLAGMIFSASAQSNPPAPNTGQTESQKSRPAPNPTGNDSQKSSSDDGGTIKVDTTLVTIPVSVLDREGKYVPHLGKRDFHLYEDNIAQEIADFASVEAPFSVVLLLDTSRSTLFRIEDIHRAALAFIDDLHPQDRVMVVSFDNDIYIDSEFTSDRTQLRRAINATRTGGATRLYDAVDLVITERLQRVKGRKAVVLFTDGVDTASNLASARSTISRVEESGVLVFPIEYNTEGQMANPGPGGRRNRPPSIMWPGSRFPRGGGRGRGRRWPFNSLVSYQRPRGMSHDDYARAAQYLRELADRSGARLYHADSTDNLTKAFSLIAEELRQQYALSYYPTNDKRDGKYRRIQVRLDQPDLVVRAREGYRAAGGDPTPAASNKLTRNDK